MNNCSPNITPVFTDLNSENVLNKDFYAEIEKKRLPLAKKIIKLNENPESTELEPGIYELTLYRPGIIKKQNFSARKLEVQLQAGLKEIFIHNIQITPDALNNQTKITVIIEFMHNFVVAAAVIISLVGGVVGVGGWALGKAEKFTEATTEATNAGTRLASIIGVSSIVILLIVNGFFKAKK